LSFQLNNLLRGIPVENHHVPKSVLEDLGDTWGSAGIRRRLSTQTEAALITKKWPKRCCDWKKQQIYPLQVLHDEPMMQHDQTAKLA